MSAKIKLIAAMLIWGSMGLFVKNIDLPSGELALFRGVIGVFSLFLVIFLKKIHITKKELLKNKTLLIVSGIALGFNWIFLFEAYKHTTVAIATLSYYLAPAIVTVLSSLILNEKLTKIKMICIMTALTGLAFVAGIFLPENQGMVTNLGILYGIAAAISYASLTLMNKFLRDLTSIEATVSQLGVASLVLLPYTLFTSSFTGTVIAEQTIMLIIVLGMIHTGLAFWLFFSSIQDLKAQTIAVLSYLDPVSAILLSAWLLKEEFTFLQIFGACLILGSTFISEISESNKVKFRTQFNR
jgi:Predicted permeases